MVRQSRRLVEYLTTDGRSLFGEWLWDLKDLRSRAQIRRRLNRLRLGNYGDFKSVGKGVLELRVHLGPGYRIYVAEDGEAVVVLLCGGDKRSQRRDIAKAHACWADYRNRR